jgi:anti-sigma B factor antagonist
MKSEAKVIDGIPTIKLFGRIDAHTAPEVWGWIEQNIVANPSIMIDLEEATFIDSAALAVLVKGMKQCRERGGDLLLISLAQPVRIIFELTRLDHAFAIYDNMPSAIFALQSAGKLAGENLHN